MGLEYVRKALVLAAVMGGMLGLVACATEGATEGTSERAGEGSDDGDGTVAGVQTREPSPTIPVPGWTPPPQAETRSSEAACGWDALGEEFHPSKVRAYAPDSAPYAGAGIHPAVLFKSDTISGSEEEPYLSTEWGPRVPGLETQLVVCQHDDDSFQSRRLGTCSYLGNQYARDSGFYTARYIYRVYEAKTGELVATFKLRGSTSLEETCPETEYVPEVRYDQLVSSEDLARRLRPLVEGRPSG